MEKRRLGRSNLEISVLTMGCWQAGKAQWTGVTDEDSVAALRAAYDSGINFFDTAEAYGKGHSEEIVAQAIGDVRDNVYIATKVAAHNLAADRLRSSCESSLKRLGTDHIDLYQLHWPAGTWGSPLIPIEESMGEMVKLQEEGKIRAIGVSNFNGDQIEEALQYGRIDSLQPPYSLFWRQYEFNDTFAVCQQHEIGVIAYSSLAQGLLTGKFSQDHKPGEDDNRSGNTLFKGQNFAHALSAIEDLKPIAAKYGVSTGQLALQWTVSQPGLTSAIVGARNSEQVQDNAKAGSFTINPDDLAAIDAIGRSVTDSLSISKTNMWTAD